jgi:hypothetical protein
VIVSLSDNVSSKNIDLILHRQSSIFKSAHTKYNLLVSVSTASEIKVFKTGISFFGKNHVPRIFCDRSTQINTALIFDNFLGTKVKVSRCANAV